MEILTLWFRGGSIVNELDPARQRRRRPIYNKMSSTSWVVKNTVSFTRSRACSVIMNEFKILSVLPYLNSSTGYTGTAATLHFLAVDVIYSIQLCYLRSNVSVQTSIPTRYDGTRERSLILQMLCNGESQLPIPLVCHSMLHRSVLRGDGRRFCHCFNVYIKVHVRPEQK